MRSIDLDHQLRRIIQRGRVMTAPAQLLAYDADGLGYKSFPPQAVVIPADSEELAQLIAAAKSLNLPITMRGAGTSLSGGPVAAQAGIVVHTSSLRKIRQIQADEFWCEVECSCTLKQLDEALKPYGLFYPPDPSSGTVCTLGGNIAMNAGGAHCFRFGVTSNYVLGVEAIMLDGTVHRFGGPAGGRGAYREDWKRLMVGSEGTLAAFTRVWLRVLPRPEKEWTFQASFPDLQSAERAIHALVAHSSFPVAIELMDPRFVSLVEKSPMAAGLPQDKFLMVTEIDGPEQLVDSRVSEVNQLLIKAGAEGVQYSDDPSRRQKLWKARKVAGGLMGQLSPDLVVQDAVIPKRSLADVLEMIYREADAVAIPVVNVFHAGDGNLHPNFMFDSRNPQKLQQVEAISKRLMRKVLEVGGTLSGEHGIGNDKSSYMPLVFGPTATQLQLSIPAAFDPEYQLNPLKMFPQRKYAHAAVTTPEIYHVEMAAEEERLFSSFIDSIDGVATIDAQETWQHIDDKVKQHHLRFPLLHSPNHTIAEHLRASHFAPASSRFGPFCDNILGMNWQLPSGEVVRIGERVAKTTTGYDLLRFLIQSPSDLGQALQYVIRLRATVGDYYEILVHGNDESLFNFADRLRHSCWIHWLDSFDYLITDSNPSTSIRLVINTPANEWELCSKMLSQMAGNDPLTVTTQPIPGPPADGLPDISIKTTCLHARQLARSINKQFGLRAVVSEYLGILHLFFPSSQVDKNLLSSIITEHRESIHALGGDLLSRHIPADPPTSAERHWLKVIAQAFQQTGGRQTDA